MKTINTCVILACINTTKVVTGFAKISFMRNLQFTQTMDAKGVIDEVKEVEVGEGKGKELPPSQVSQYVIGSLFYNRVPDIIIPKPA